MTAETNQGSWNKSRGGVPRLPGIFFIRIITCLVAMLMTVAAYGMEIVPFETRNLSPLVQIFGLPATGSARIVPTGVVAEMLSVDAVNNFAADVNGPEAVFFDGETYRFSLGAKAGLADGVEAGIVIPVIVQGGGVQDRFLEGWHSFFGLPNGDRELFPRNRLRYRYQRDLRNRVTMERSGTGLGDIQLTTGIRLRERDEEMPVDLALRASLKLPTGSSSRLFGSGSYDFALWLSASEDVEVPMGHVTGFGSLGGMVMTRGDILPGMQRNLAGFASFGLGWSPYEWLAFKTQINGHTAFYSGSRLRELGENSLQLVIGGTLSLSDKTVLDLGVSEDLSVKTAPDIGFHLALRRGF